MATGVLALVAPGHAGAQQGDAARALTEVEVVTLALGRAPLAEVIEGSVAVETGKGRVAGAYPNPIFNYLREQTYGPLGTGEDYVSVAQTVDLGNRRGLHGQAGDARARAARREGDAARLAVAADARHRFYEVLYRQHRVAALQAWAAHVEQALGIVGRRELRGDAAPYDRRRLERERSVALGRLATDQAALERARARLRAVLARPSSVPVASGVLLPPNDPAPVPALRSASSARPDLAALDLRVEATALDKKAAARWWAPDLRVEGGWKGVAVARQGRTDGFLFALTLAVPLWDQSSGLAAIAEGEARAARGRKALLEAELDGELGGARAEALRLRRAALEFRSQTAGASAELERMAAAGYSGGELGLIELLDAYRGAADDSLGVLDLELAARRARIELDRLTGAGLP